MKKRVAIIDLGTNTFNLLVIDLEGDNYVKITKSKVGVGLGLGGINEGRIGEEAWNRGVSTLKRYREICEEYEVKSIHALGTSALRSADNGEEFVAFVRENIGIDISIISGEKEAEYIFKGVGSNYHFDKRSLIMDIGGGSTEFILVEGNAIKKAKSFDIGVARIFQMFQPTDPYSKQDCQNIIDFLEITTAPFFDDIQVEKLIGSSGSFETFYELATNIKFPKDEYVSLSKKEIMVGLNHIIASTQKERDENPLIMPIRKKMAPIAAINIKWMIEKLNINEIIISPYALKEGVIEAIK